MATMQEQLLQKKMDKELPERVAERELQDAKAKLAEDREDIKTIEKWHLSAVEPRMIEWQRVEMQRHEVCPVEGEVLFCDMKVDKEQEVARIFVTKSPLVTAWYEHKHGLNNVSFRTNQKGTMTYLRFGFYSADMEGRVHSKCLEGRRHFEAQVRAALYVLRAKTELPVNVLKIINQFIPDYVEHVKQEQKRVENTLRW
jgi:hypothetical protein